MSYPIPLICERSHYQMALVKSLDKRRGISYLSHNNTQGLTYIQAFGVDELNILWDLCKNIHAGMAQCTRVKSVAELLTNRHFRFRKREVEECCVRRQLLNIGLKEELDPDMQLQVCRKSQTWQDYSGPLYLSLPNTA